MITSARLVLEPVTPAHAAAMFSGLQDKRAYRYMPEEPPETVDALQARYANLATGLSPDGTELWLNWMVRHGPDYVGYVQATVINAAQAVLVAYHIFPEMWRRGYGREAVAAMLAAVTARHGLVEARAYIDTRNTASIALVESLGFTLRDTIANADVFRGERSDEYFYTKRLGD
jgi:RimJ/RimL family protein N-acetyltransferase